MLRALVRPFAIVMTTILGAFILLGRVLAGKRGRVEHVKLDFDRMKEREQSKRL
jgi:hypothetical protein